MQIPAKRALSRLLQPDGGVGRFEIALALLGIGIEAGNGPVSGRLDPLDKAGSSINRGACRHFQRRGDHIRLDLGEEFGLDQARRDHSAQHDEQGHAAGDHQIGHANGEVQPAIQRPVDERLQATVETALDSLEASKDAVLGVRTRGGQVAEVIRQDQQRFEKRQA